MAAACADLPAAVSGAGSRMVYNSGNRFTMSLVVYIILLLSTIHLGSRTPGIEKRNLTLYNLTLYIYTCARKKISHFMFANPFCSHEKTAHLSGFFFLPINVSALMFSFAYTSTDTSQAIDGFKHVLDVLLFFLSCRLRCSRRVQQSLW